MTRPTADRLFDMLDEGMDKDKLILAFVGYLTDDELKEMMEMNELLPEEDEDEEDE